MSIGTLVSRRPRVGDLVAIPVDRDDWGVMVALPRADGNDNYGFVKGLWSLESISDRNWAPEVFPTPFVTANSILRELGWKCVGFRPDLAARFDPPAWLVHPSEADPDDPDESYGDFGVEMLPGGKQRKLSKEEAQRRFLLLDGDYFRVIQPEQIVALYREHFRPAKDRPARSERSEKHAAAPKPRTKQKRLGPLKRARFFSSWKGFAPVSSIQKAEAAVHHAVEALEGKSPSQALRQLRALVRTFNKLDGAEGFEFGTLEAETIMDAVRTVASACGIPERELSELDEERDF